MNNRQAEEIEKKQATDQPGPPPSQGPSLLLLYAFIGLALLVAFILAGLIVLPFYQHRH